MSFLPDKLLVSSPNGGGVLLVDGGVPARLSCVDGTGLALTPHGLLRGLQSESDSTLAVIDQRGYRRISLAEESLDIHDVLHTHRATFVACTEFNGVIELDDAFTERRRWSFPGEPDSVHLNCLCLHRGRLLASMFGDFSEHRVTREKPRVGVKYAMC